MSGLGYEECGVKPFLVRTDHHHRSRCNHVHQASVCFPREVREEQVGKNADNIRGDCSKLLRDNACSRVDSSDDTVRENAQGLKTEHQLLYEYGSAIIAPTYVGRKKASPWTVILSSKKIKATAMVAGLKIPRKTFVLSILSKTVVAPTFSDLTRAIAKTVEKNQVSLYRFSKGNNASL